MTARQTATRELWQRTLPETRARIGCVEAAATALLEGDLSADLRHRAVRAAHQLAGSVGTFGYADASVAARAVEERLGEGVLDEPALLELCEQVRTLREQLDPAGGRVTAAARDAGQGLLAVITADSTWHERVRGEAAARGYATWWGPDVAAFRDLAPPDPDAILIDLSSASKNAGALLAELSARRATVVVVTATDQLAERIAAARAGAGRVLLPDASARDAVDAVTDLIASRSLADASAVVWSEVELAGDAVALGLRALGMAVVTATDVESTWQAITQHRPSVLVAAAEPALVADLCRVVRTDGRWNWLPVVARAEERGAAAAQLYEAGVDDVHAGTVQELVARVRSRVSRARLAERDAEVDPLTGLPNDAGAHRYLDRLLSMAQRHGQPVAVALLQIDGFARINDLHGRSTGDDVLQLTAALLRDAFRGEDIAARLGGGEFLVALYASSSEHAAERLRALVSAAASRGVVGPRGTPVTVSLSAGVAAVPSDGHSRVAVRRAATEALRRARLLGGGEVALAGAGGTPDAAATVDVAIVEDDNVVGTLLKEALQTKGYQVLRIADGAEAVRQLAGPSVRARVVLLDVDLPGLDGFTVLRRFAEAGTLDDSRVIVLTVHSTDSETLTALEGGAFDHVCKPFSLPVLLERVRRALED